jgi:hypothetical protein
MEHGTGIEVKVVNKKGNPINNDEVILVGNYNSYDKREVKDQLFFRTYMDGKVALTFPKYSIITSIWHVSAEKAGTITEYKYFIVKPVDVNRISF